jgi:predicted Rossmann fold nucleotide-binding protein DprA/Smf involved in DNA uptake
MKALVCGGRNYSDLKYLFQVLDLCMGWWKLKTIITGGAKGADSLAHEWAIRRKLQTEVYMADWDLHGKAAGMIRNREMLIEGQPNVVIAFPGTTGTENMITIARKALVPVFIPGEGK